jgi:ATP-dependent Clp protease ATP-binding subunit ClpC
MFERYTEKARRVVFFARYEASQYGSDCIETEHLLLGIMRELKWLTTRLLPDGSADSIRAQIDACTPHRERTSTAVDMPLSSESQRVLAFAAKEAELLDHKYIGTEHLLLGLLREENCFAERMLRERGAELSKLRLELAKTAQEPWPHLKNYSIPARGSRVAIHDTVEIHGSAWHVSYVRNAVDRCREYSWH